MKRALSILFVVIAATSAATQPVATPALDKPPERPPIVAFRSSLTIGDPDRDWNYCWTRAGDLKLSWTVGGETQQPFIASWAREGYDPLYHGGFRLPPKTPIGPLAVDYGDRNLTFTVKQSASRKSVTIAPYVDASTTREAIQKALDAGYRRIVLAPGLHQFDRMIWLPGGTAVYGYGATIKRLKTADYGENGPSFGLAGPEVSVYGLTFAYDQRGMAFFANGVGGRGLVCADCEFRRCNFGFWMTETLVRDCKFIGGGAVNAPAGLWLRCTFTGPPQSTAWDHWGGGKGDPVAMIDCVFDGSDRGPCFNAAYLPINDFLSVGLTCRGINGTPNGNEILLVEGDKPFDRAIILHTRISGCQSSFVQLDQVSRNGLVRDVFIDGGPGVCMWGKDVSGWEFSDFEFRNGAGIYCAAGAKHNRFSNGSIIGWLPGRGGQTYQHMSPLLLKRTTACIAEGPQAATNTLERVLFFGVNPPFRQSIGFAVK